VLADTFYYENEAGGQEWVAPKDVKFEKNAKGKVIKMTDAQGQNLSTDGMSKMSKSKNNGVDPAELIEKYGADTLRVFSMFAAPPDQSMEWSDTGVEGANRFIKRLWRQVFEHVKATQTKGDGFVNIADIDADKLTNTQQETRRRVYNTLEKVTDDMSRRFTFNTAIAANMELINQLSKFHETDEIAQAIRQEALESIVLMLSPVMPHVAQELWLMLGKDGLVMDQPWPEIDEDALEQSNIQMMIQINGKLRGKVDVDVDADDKTVEKLALENDNVVQFLENKTIRKVIVVKGRLINIVAN
jgi:leucyl-tRNA synthetase